MVDDYMLNKILDKIKVIIGIECFDNTKILIHIDDICHMILLWKMLWNEWPALLKIMKNFIQNNF